MYEDMANTPLAEFERRKTKIKEKEYDMLYDPADDLVVLLNYAPGRCVIYKGKRLGELMELDENEMRNHPEAKMCLAEHDELEISTPAELFKEIF